MSELKTRFGKLVAAHRRRRGLTQQQLADDAELSGDMIARIETGATGVSFTSIEKLATALDVDPAELFSDQIPKGALQRRALSDVTVRLAGLSDRDLVWIGNVIDAALKSRR